MKRLSRLAATLLALPTMLLTVDAAAQSSRALDVRSARAIEHWTPERRAAAIPRDLVIDERGLGYLRGHGNQLIPYGHTIMAKPGGGTKDTTGPSVTNLLPAAGATIGAASSFSATVSDASGVGSVSFVIQGPTGQPQSFNGTQGSGGTWSVNLSGFTNGSWSYHVVAKDRAKPANTTTTAPVAFTVDTGTGGGGGGADTVVNSPWTAGGVVQRAAGRIYFEMPDNARRTRWAGYVCSGTVVDDATAGRSVILTAAHCVYDDANKAFARNVLFIPDQDGTTAAGTDRTCSNDPIGCWAPQFGLVDTNWTTRTFPNNVAWDYAYYVVSDSGAHSAGMAAASDTLDAAVTAMAQSFNAPAVGNVTHALGYSLSDDPNFMFCADPMEALDAVNWWLPNCGLSGGSSGGPWVQPMSLSTGNGTVISVNSWGYTGQPGMAGPKLSGTSASCVFERAKASPLGLTYADGDAGVVATCP